MSAAKAKTAVRRRVESRIDPPRSSRTVAPLKPADDAVVIDTDRLGLEDVVDTILTDISDTVGGA